MNGGSAISSIEQKMAEMRLKNLEILKRHQEIEEDRQLAQRSGATTTITKSDSIVDTTTAMRGTTKSRGRNTITQQNSYKNSYEQTHRAPVRRKFENDRTDVQSQRTQRIDYNRLKHERELEHSNQEYDNGSINPELLEYAYPSYHRSDDGHANRTGSGRINQQQRTQEQGQRRREERMRRTGMQNNGYTGETTEFHLDVPQIPMWQNNSLPPPIHVQLIPTNLNGHHTTMDHFMNNTGDQIDQSVYPHNFMYPSPAPNSSFNGNVPLYFAHPPSPMSNGMQSSQPHFHQFYPTRTFENSNRQHFNHSPHFQSSANPSATQLSTPSSATSHIQQQEQDNSSVEVPPRFRRLKNTDQENQYSKQRPMSGDFERLHNSSPRFSNDNRFHSRPQSFYEFPSQQQQQLNNNVFRSSNNHNRYARNNNNNNNNNTILPLTAYMNTNDSSYENENYNNNTYWGASYQRRRTTKPRTYHQDKHQFPLSSYDPRQYGFNNNYQRRNDLNGRSRLNRHDINNSGINDSNDIDLIEEWWEDENTELIGTNQSTVPIDSQTTSTGTTTTTTMTTTTTTTVNDSGNSSLSTSIHLKESTLDDEENNTSIHDFISPSSDVSTTDSNIIESLDQLQQQLKLEEDVEKQLELENELLDKELLSLTKESTTYDTAHFLQWAKEKFREELAVRLTAQGIQQHDAAITDDDDDDDDIIANKNVDIEKFHIDHTTDEDHDNNFDELEKDLHEKLAIDDNTTKSIIVE